MTCDWSEPPLTAGEIRSLRAMMRANGYGAPYAVTPNPNRDLERLLAEIRHFIETFPAKLLNKP